MSIHSQDNQTDTPQQFAESAGERSASGKSTLRPALSPAAIRRRAIFFSLGILLFLLLVGLGDAFAGFLPHTTAPFTNGRTQTAGSFQVMVQFTPNPPKYSFDPTTLVQITVTRAGQAVDDAHVQLSLSMVTMDMGANEAGAQGLGQGRYQARVAFVMPGAWQMKVTITPPGGASTSTTFAVDVAN